MPYDAKGRWVSDIEWHNRKADAWRLYESQIALGEMKGR